MGMTTKDHFEFGSSHQLTNHVHDIVPNDPLCRRKVADPHLDDPALDIGDLVGPSPLLYVSLHWDVFGLPMVVFHGLVELIRPLIFQRENVEKHGVLPVDHAFGSKRFLRFFLV